MPVRAACCILFFSILSYGQTVKPLNIPRSPTYAELQTFLSLTAEQIDQLKQLQQKRQLFSAAAYAKIAAKQKQLNDMLSAGSTDALAIGKLNIEIYQTRSEVSAPTDEREQAKAILTQEQIQKLTSLQEALLLRQAADQAASLYLVEYPKTVLPPRPGVQ